MKTLDDALREEDNEKALMEPDQSHICDSQASDGSKYVEESSDINPDGINSNLHNPKSEPLGTSQKVRSVGPKIVLNFDETKGVFPMRKFEDNHISNSKILNDEFSDYNGCDTPEFIQWSKTFETYDKKPGRVLDIGCGHGIITKAISEEYNLEVIGCDLDYRLIEFSVAYNQIDSNLQYICADGCQLPFENNSFDYIITINTLHHMENPIGFIREMHRVCKPEGFIQIQDLVRDFAFEKQEGIKKNESGLLYDSLLAALNPLEYNCLAKDLGDNIRDWEIRYTADIRPAKSYHLGIPRIIWNIHMDSSWKPTFDWNRKEADLHGQILYNLMTKKSHDALYWTQIAVRDHHE